ETRTYLPTHAGSVCHICAGIGRDRTFEPNSGRRNFHRPNRADLDTTLPTETTSGDLARPLNCFVNGCAVQNVITRELLFGLSERTIHRQSLSLTISANSDRGGSRLKRLGALKYSPLFCLAHHGAMPQGDLFVLFRGRLSFARIDQHHVAHRVLLGWPGFICRMLQP